MQKSSHKQQQEQMERNMEKKLQEAKNKEQQEIERKKAARNLSHVPGKCPVSQCPEIVFPSNMMMHMLHKHIHGFGVTKSEIYDHKPVVVCVDPTSYEYGKNHCVATLMYGGVKGKPRTQPGLSYLSIPNSALINDHRKYENYLPIMMMVCRCTWYAQMKDKELERDLVTKNGSKAGLYVFWLVAPSTARKLYYSITVYDRYYLNSRSVVRMVRDYTNFQNPSDFLPYEENYLLLRDTETIEFLSGGKPQGSKLDCKPGIPMEIIIYENPSDRPVQHSSTKELMEALERVQEVGYRDSLPHIKGSLKRGSSSGKLTRAKKTIFKPTSSSNMAMSNKL